MIHHVLSFAGYPIYLIKKEYNLSDEELNFIKSLEYKNHDSVQNLKLSINTDILQLTQLKKLKDFIKKSLDNYVQNVLEINNTFSFCQSWSTIQNKKGYHPPHTHRNQMISCVYYGKVKQTTLKFTLEKSKIEEAYYFDYSIKNNNVFNSSNFSINLESGDLIFFPGHMKHESSVNDDNERIIVGSSFFIDGIIGSKNLTNRIDITNNKNIQYSK